MPPAAEYSDSATKGHTPRRIVAEPALARAEISPARRSSAMSVLFHCPPVWPASVSAAE